MSSALTVIIPVLGTLAAAGIAAAVALHVRRSDRRADAELRHSEARDHAYQAFMAACDRAWHMRVKRSVDRCQGRDGIPDEEVARIKDLLNQQVALASEELRAHSRDYSVAGPIITLCYDVAFDSKIPTKDNFERARTALQELQRREAGLRGTLGREREASFIRKFILRRQIRAKYKSRTAFRIDYGQGGEKDEVLVYQGDGEEILDLFNAFTRQWEELEASVGIQEVRSVRWKQLGLWPE